MACTLEYSDRIARLAAGRLDAAESGELLAHVAMCAACSSELDDAAVAAVAAQALPAAPVASPPRIHLAWWIAAAAALALAVALFWRGAPAPHRLAQLARAPSLAAPTVTLRANGTERSAEYRAAMARYTAGEFTAAADLLRAVTRDEPDDALAWLYLGICSLHEPAATPAAAALASAAALGNGLLQERALWFLADAHLLAGDGDGATATLERLVALDGDYRPNAEAKLAELRALLGR